ncbi:hypothetical protein EC968_008307 [Mortierella alpina]|nr:hypothetical protein EC968_008307 [Mortierella alpina]
MAQPAGRGHAQRSNQGQQQQRPSNGRQGQVHAQAQAQAQAEGQGQDGVQGQHRGNMGAMDFTSQSSSSVPGGSNQESTSRLLQAHGGQGLKRGPGTFYSSATQRVGGGLSSKFLSSASTHCHQPHADPNSTSQFHRAPANYNTPATQFTSTHLASMAIASAAETQSMSLSQAFALGYSIPTSKFNTEAFGTLSVRPPSNSTMPTTAASNASHGAGVRSASTGESLDDILDIPIDFDDEDFGDMGMTIDKDTTGLIPEEVVQSQMPTQLSQSGVERVLDSQAGDEATLLKQRLSEMERLLKEREDQLLIKTGEAAIVKTNLDVLTKEHNSLAERYKAADLQHQADKQSLEEKHRRELANTNMNHQFEVQKFMLDGPSGAKHRKGPDLPRQPVSISQTASYPNDFSGFSSQASIKVAPRNDGFSIHNFGVQSRSPRKTRSTGMSNASLEKPRPFALANEQSKPARPVFGFSSNIPTQSAEEIIRDKLLAGQEDDFGLRQLRIIKVDEEGEHPLPPLRGTTQHTQNCLVEEITRQCVGALIDLTCNVNSESKSLALRTTTTLLQSSLISKKPFHAMNALKVLRILYFTYEDIASEVSRGAVPFLENEHENPATLTPSETSLPSALACIHCLFISRIALSSQTPHEAGFTSSMTKLIDKMTPEAERQLETDVLLLLDLVARDQSSEKRRLTNSKLIRSQIYDDGLRLHLEGKNYRTIDRMLGILDIVSRETECCRLLIGWSVTRNTWTESFKQVDTLIALLEVKADNDVDIANGLIPQLKMKVLDILGRLIAIEVEQTRKIIRKTRLMKAVICSIQDLVELAGRIHYQRTFASIWQHSTSAKQDTPTAGLSCKTKSETGDFGSIVATHSPDPFEAFSLALGSSHGKQKQRAVGSTELHSDNPSRTSSPGPAPGSNTCVPTAELVSSSSLSETGTRPYFSSFLHNTHQSLQYKPAILNRTSFDCGVSNGPCPPASSSRLELLGPHHQVFDYLAQLKLEMEFLLTIFRTIPGYVEALAEKDPNNFHALVFAVGAIAVRDLGLPVQAQYLAQDLLTELVEEEEEEEYLALIRDKPKK